MGMMRLFCLAAWSISSPQTREATESGLMTKTKACAEDLGHPLFGGKDAFPIHPGVALSPMERLVQLAHEGLIFARVADERSRLKVGDFVGPVLRHRRTVYYHSPSANAEYISAR